MSPTKPFSKPVLGHPPGFQIHFNPIPGSYPWYPHPVMSKSALSPIKFTSQISGKSITIHKIHLFISPYHNYPGPSDQHLWLTTDSQSISLNNSFPLLHPIFTLEPGELLQMQTWLCHSLALKLSRFPIVLTTKTITQASTLCKIEPLPASPDSSQIMAFLPHSLNSDHCLFSALNSTGDLLAFLPSTQAALPSSSWFTAEDFLYPFPSPPSSHLDEAPLYLDFTWLTTVLNYTWLMSFSVLDHELP